MIDVSRVGREVVEISSLELNFFSGCFVTLLERHVFMFISAVYTCSLDQLYACYYYSLLSLSFYFTIYCAMARSELSRVHVNTSMI